MGLAESRPRWASIAKRWGEPGDRSFHFGLFGDDGDLEVHVTQPNGEESQAREGRPLPTGRWHHVAFVADGQYLRLYRNGFEVAKTGYTGLQPGGLMCLASGSAHRPAPGRTRLSPVTGMGGSMRSRSFTSLVPDQIRRLYQLAAKPEANSQP